jgi:superfamily II DNA or RNA helicase
MLESVSSFQNFTKLLSEKNNKEKGNAFEQLVYAYFKLEPKYSFYDEVWPFSDVPSLVLEELMLPSQDIGIDLIAKIGDEYHAIQCKYHQDNSQSVTFKEVSTFISLLESNTKITQGYICSTADITSRILGKLNTKPINLLLNDTWAELDELFFARSKAFLEGKKPKELVSYKPKEHQKKALKSAKEYFIQENKQRGKLIFPCGAGKSLTGYWMTTELKAKKTIVAVPSLSLVKQTLEVYLREVVASKRSVKWLCICSDEGIGKDDDIVYFTENIGVPCQTDALYIQNWLEANKDEEIFIFTTYQSGRIIADISKQLGITFDLGIFDEAHKTVGANKKLFSHLLFEENISISKRIFMTATERFYKGSKDDIISMDDEDIYGDTFAQMSFKEAIETGLLTDYKVITIEIQKSEIAEFIRENNLVQLNDKWKKETEARSMASMLALRKAMKMFPIKNAVSFHSSIEKAVRNKELQQYITETYDYQPIDTFTVSGKQATSKRNSIVQEFARSEHSLITNARCLTEGVDVPNIDCIIFSDPRKSKVDIVQALGRALRKKEGKDWGYVILPIIYDDTTQEIDNDNFQEILSIVRGLASNDERIVEFFKDKEQTNNKKETKDGQFHLEVFSDYMDASDLASQLQIKLWEKLSRFSWMPFEEAREFVRGLNLTNDFEWRNYVKSGIKPNNIPNTPNEVYDREGWISLGDWLGSGRIANKNIQFLDFFEAREFVRSLNIITSTEWNEYRKSESRPSNIPSNPNVVYKNSGYLSMEDWLGTKPNFKGVYKSFDEAKRFVHTLKLQNLHEWKKYCTSGLKPHDIPSNPNQTYENSGWKGVGDWLGTGSIANFNREYWDFSTARNYSRGLGLKTRSEWILFCKSDIRPKEIPYSPEKIYLKEGWISYSDWLGSEIVANQNREYLSYDEAQLFVKKLALTSQKQWQEYCKTGNKPNNIPSDPRRVYEKSGWVDLHIWLGNDEKSKSNMDFLNFEKARKIIKSLKLSGQKEWSEYCKSKDFPLNIPKSPHKYYSKEWLGFGDWLGTGNVSNINKEFISFNEARKFARNLNLKSASEWKKFCSSGKRPNDVPSNPSKTYENSGWIDFNDWLGSKNVSTRNINWMNFENAREYVRKLKLKNEKEWKVYCKSGSKPANIPYDPKQVYRNYGYINFGDWLGSGNQASGSMDYLSFEKAREIVRELQIETTSKWKEFVKSGHLPLNIPKAPHYYYRDNGWTSYGDWLGTGIIAPQNRVFLDFEAARDLLRKYKIHSSSEYFKLYDSGLFPEGLPKYCNGVYANKGWKGWGDFLGKEK